MGLSIFPPMLNSIQERILVALLAALKPIVRALLRSGIGFREFSEVAKTAFVQVATKDYGIRGRPTNVSRVAVMTGLTRKEVKRLRDMDPKSIGNIPKRSAPADLLHYWHTDPEYCDQHGSPRPLAYEGAGISFVSLVKRCAGDLPSGALKTELKRVGAVVEYEDGTLRVAKRYFIPGNVDDRLELGLHLGIATIGSTIAFNCDPNRKGPARFQRISDSDLIDKDSLLKLQQKLSVQMDGFLAKIDQQFSEVESDNRITNPSNLCRVGVGIYFFTSED